MEVMNSSMIDYINEAIVEMEANEAGADSDVRLHGLLQSIAHNGGHIRTCCSIKWGVQLSLWVTEQQCYENGGYCYWRSERIEWHFCFDLFVDQRNFLSWLVECVANIWLQLIDKLPRQKV